MSDKKNDPLGDRVKALESESVKALLDEDLPICVRIDGKAFSQYTKGLARPYDERLSKIMVETTNYLLEQTDARLGYTQSDEISLVYFKTGSHQQSYFGARMQKLVSVLASMATAKFNSEIAQSIPERQDTFAFFDCRAWNVPTLQDAADVFIWRQDDAIKNAVSMAAHAYYDHGFLHGKSSVEKINLLKDKGIDWKDYPEFFKSGTYSMKKHMEVPIDEELKKYKANEGKETFLRSYTDNFHLPRLRHMEDVVGFLFDPIFEDYKTTIADKMNRKKKM